MNFQQFQLRHAFIRMSEKGEYCCSLTHKLGLIYTIVLVFLQIGFQIMWIFSVVCDNKIQFILSMFFNAMISCSHFIISHFKDRKGDATSKDNYSFLK